MIENKRVVRGRGPLLVEGYLAMCLTLAEAPRDRGGHEIEGERRKKQMRVAGEDG